MKILFVHSAYQQLGGEDVAFAQERELVERGGHQVVSYCRSNDEASSYTHLGKLRLLKQVVWATDTRREVAGLLIRERPDLVHVHNTFLMISPSIYYACRDAQVPVVQTLHNYRVLCPAASFFRAGKVCEECTHHGLRQSVRYGCYRNSRAETAGVALMLAFHRGVETWTRMVDCYIALSEFARNKFVEGGLPRERVMVKPNFVPAIRGKDEGRGEYALFVGRLSAEKGLRTLIAAWTRLRQPIPLILVGDGPLRTELSVEVQRHGLSGINFRGRLPRDQTLELMSGARFLVLPSECYENFPVSIAEAFSCSTPVICSRLGALEEIVENGRTGLHVIPADPQDLADKVEWAWQQPSRMQTMGLEARTEYEAKYTPERNYQLLMAIYEHTLTGYAQGHSRTEATPDTCRCPVSLQR